MIRDNESANGRGWVARGGVGGSTTEKYQSSRSMLHCNGGHREGGKDGEDDDAALEILSTSKGSYISTSQGYWGGV